MEMLAVSSTDQRSKHADRMSLRLKINLLLAILMTLFVGIFVYLEFADTRRSVYEEIEASNRIAIQLLTRIGWLFQTDDPNVLAEFLKQTGRVRANDISLFDGQGHLLYTSPEPVYKAGRNAPAWYSGLVSPVTEPRRIILHGGELVITGNASRAILDGWDNLLFILWITAPMFVSANIVVFWLVGRWVAPLEKIQQALQHVERGDTSTRLPALPGREAGGMGRAFNQMVRAIEDNIQARQAAAESTALLGAQREFTQLLQQSIEEERRSLARELHDDLGQSLTAIRSIAQSIALQVPDQTSPLSRSARLLTDTASDMYDAMHRMIPRLRPSALDELGLGEAVRDLVSDIQIKHPELEFQLHLDSVLPQLSENIQISAYRIIQEALTNVIRHARATQVSISLGCQRGELLIGIFDNGAGTAEDLSRPGHYGVLGMRERAQALGGEIAFGRSESGGLAVSARIPVSEVTSS